MNCKPGDLAFVAFVTNPNVVPHLGRVVRCLRLDEDSECWSTAPELEPGKRVYDGALKPIRDPGEDAVDEILQKVGLPTFPLERQEA